MTATDNSSDRLADEARRGQEAFDRHVKPNLRPEDDGKFVAVEIQTGKYEIDADDFEASERLLSRCPGARIWLFRAGFATAYQMLSRRSPGELLRVALAISLLLPSLALQGGVGGG